MPFKRKITTPQAPKRSSRKAGGGKRKRKKGPDTIFAKSRKSM
jgi:hypothetical protein